MLQGRDDDVAPVLVNSCFLFQEKRLSDLSNQSHDSQVSNSTLSANSHEDRHNVSAPSQREDLVDGHYPQEEEELDDMEVEYIEVNISDIYDVIDSTPLGITNPPDNNLMMPPFTGFNLDLQSLVSPADCALCRGAHHSGRG